MSKSLSENKAISVIEQKGQAITSSRNVAEIFEKKHFHVMESIRNCEASEEFRTSNFRLTEYLDSQNKRQPEYMMTRNGFAFIVFGFTGKEAAKFKEDYIKKFDEMESQIKLKQLAKAKSQPIRLILTETIKALPDSPHKRFKYKQYTDLVYKFIFDKNTKQLREMYGIGSKETPRDYFTADELERVSKLENQVSTLIELEMTYEEIKEILSKKTLAIQNLKFKE